MPSKSLMPALVLMPALLLSACGGRGDKDRQEDISSLRSLGVAINPLIMTPSTVGAAPNTATVTLYAAVPLSQTATLTAFKDTGSSEGAISVPLSDITITPSSGSYEVHNNFKIFSAQATINIPTLAKFQAVLGKTFIGGQLRYGLTVATETAQENVIANIVVLPAGDAETAWSNPTISIDNPIDKGTVSISSDNDLNATVNNPNNETLKIRWFVSSGEISNRNAVSTVWTLSDVGPATAVVVVHGTQSRGFNLQVVDVVGW